jgi:hypothetical protein
VREYFIEQDSFRADLLPMPLLIGNPLREISPDTQALDVLFQATYEPSNQIFPWNPSILNQPGIPDVPVEAFHVDTPTVESVPGR